MSGCVFVGTRKGLFTIEKNSGCWAISRTSFLGDNVSIVLPDPRDGAIYAALDHGHFGVKLQRSADGGASWEEIGVPVYPEKPENEIDNDPFRGTPREWKLNKIWALVPGGADEPGVLWCGTIPGGLFRSADHGKTWTLVESLWNHPGRKRWFGGGADLPGIHSICVDPRNSSRVAVGVSCGGVWATDDGGASWECRANGMRAAYMPPEFSNDPGIQDAHLIVRCRNQPDVLWAQHHNGIFRSTDDSASWSEVENVAPSAFGFAVAVHPNRGDTAWFVPAIKDEKRIPVDGRLVVTRTRDGGKSFDVLTDGLPQHHAYDIVYRHALDIDSRGDALCFGSTTGTLCISDNQGDFWHVVSTHLPPVYCVRFVD